MLAVTQLISKWNDGDSHALDELISIAYTRLHLSAKRALGIYNQNQSLQATELVSELYCHFKTQNGINCIDSAEFYAIAAYKLRQILQGRYRDKKRIKRDFGIRESGHKIDKIPHQQSLFEILVVRKTIDVLKSIDPQAALLVELKTFWEFDNREIAEILGISERSINRHWRWCKAWLIQSELT